MLLDNIWVINLDKSKDRLEKMKKNFDKYNLKFNRFKAIEGKKLSNYQIEKNTSWLCRNILCNHGIVGCGMSHMELWRQLLNDNTTDKYIILEDDAVLDQKSVDILSKIEKYIDKYDINMLNLYSFSLVDDSNLKFQIDGFKFGKSKFTGYLTGYILTKKGAEIFLDNIKKINYHIDFQIGYINFFKDLNIYASSPKIISCSDDTTTIGDKYTSPTIKILDEIGFKKTAWQLNSPQITIKMFFVINSLFMILILLLFLNKTKFNYKILYWFLILEFFVYVMIYF